MSDWVSTHPVLEMERQRADAVLSGDTSALSALLAEDLRYVHATSACHDKAAYLAYLQTAPKFLSIAVDEAEVLDLGDRALLRGRLRMQLQKGEALVQASSWLSQVWRRVGAQWQLLNFQSTKDSA